MWALAWRTLRFRKGGAVATFLALFFGTVLVMACGGLLETGVRNNAPPERLARADLVLTGDRGYELPRSGGDDEDVETAVLPERVPVDPASADVVRGVPGVRSAVAERTFDAALLGARGPRRVQGHGWESAALTPYALVSGHPPRQPGDVVLDRRTARGYGASVGDRVRIAAHGGADAYRVSGIARPAAPGASAASAVRTPRATVFFSGARARALSGDVVTDIAVVAARGQGTGALAARVGEAVRDGAGTGPGVRVVTGDARGAVEYPGVLDGRDDLIALAAVFGGMATLVSVFVVSGTVALSVAQRQREFALMRAIGGTPRQLRRMLLGETLTVAVLAAGGAWFAGPPVGRWLFRRLVSGGMVEPVVDFRLGWLPGAAAGGALLLTALLGGWTGARRAVRARPAEALAEAGLGERERWLHPVRLIAALLFLGGATALAVVTFTVFDGPVAASTAGPTVICAAIGLALLGPGLTRATTALLSPFVRALTGTGGGLAVLNCRARAIRMASVVTPLMLATGMATGNLYLQTTQTEAARDAFRANLRADAVLAAPAGGVDPAVLGAVRKLREVGAAGAHVTTTAFVERPYAAGQDEDGLPVQGVSADAAARTTAVVPSEGSLGRLRGRTVALSEARAAKLGRGVGDTVRLRLGDGAAASVRIVALFPGRPGYETALAPATLLAAHTTDGLPQQVLLRAAKGTSDSELTAALGAFASRHPGLAVADRESLIAANTEDTRTQAWVNYLLVGMIVAYTALSVVNSLVTSTNGRRREFGLQRLTGATRAQVMRMVTVEALLVAVTGIVLGTLAAATSLVPFSHVAADSWLPHGPLWIYGAVVATALGLSLTASLLPTWSALRVRPARAAVAGAG